jgi:hypothetical protein
MPFRLIAAIFIFLAASAPALADSAKSLGRFEDWEAFTLTDKAGKVCYTASLPKRSLNSFKGRGDAYVSVTHRPNDKSFDVISVMFGYPLKKDAPAEIDIGGAKFDLYTTGDTGWSRNDKAVVQAMLKGNSMVVHGSPTKGEQTADTYSLAGFAKAFAEIGKTCGVK